jgi:hypothetical protein
MDFFMAMAFYRRASIALLQTLTGEIEASVFIARKVKAGVRDVATAGNSHSHCNCF